jgi:polysaccharide export outer membrane protein
MLANSRVLGLFLAFGALSACSSPWNRLPLMPQVIPAVYTIGPGDDLNVKVVEQEELTGRYKVSADGTVSFPFLGAVPITGLTPAQAQQAIADRLSPRFLRDPYVAVEVAQYRPIYVLGEVQSPGSYPFADNLTVEKAIAAAGGYTYRGKKDPVRITRNVNDVTLVGRGSRYHLLLPGDVVYVYERHF